MIKSRRVFVFLVVIVHIILSLSLSDFVVPSAAERFALPALGRAAERRPTGKMLRRRKMLGIAPDSPASGARFVGQRLCWATKQCDHRTLQVLLEQLGLSRRDN